MTAQKLPTELLARIIGYMESPKSARLVCRTWNVLAVPHAFRAIVLRPTEESTGAWEILLGNERIKDAIRHVIIYSHTTEEDEEYTDEVPPELTEVLPRINELKFVENISLNFSPLCCGEESMQVDMTEHEWYQKRVQMFEFVFSAIQERSYQPSMTRIRSFSTNNMQNSPISIFTSSDLFKSVIKEIDELHLSVIEEYDEIREENNLHGAERVTFEPWLQQSWLMPIADHIKILSLSFGLCWGTAPGTFNGRGLTFPQLETLTLGSYTISHYDHFDWVLKQTTLKSLRLNDCSIATVLRLNEGLELWNLDLHDWETLADDAFGSDWGELYFFPGTWELIFDKICTSLPHLIDFQFLHQPRYTSESNNTTPISTSLNEKRYNAFCEGQGWLETAAEFGDMDLTDMSPGDQAMLERSKSTQEGDQRALQELLEKIEKRQNLQELAA